MAGIWFPSRYIEKPSYSMSFAWPAIALGFSQLGPGFSVFMVCSVFSRQLTVKSFNSIPTFAFKGSQVLEPWLVKIGLASVSLSGLAGFFLVLFTIFDDHVKSRYSQLDPRFEPSINSHMRTAFYAFDINTLFFQISSVPRSQHQVEMVSSLLGKSKHFF